MDIPNNIQDLWSFEGIERLFDSSGIGFLFVSPEQNILDASNGFCDKIGYSRDELLTMSIADLTHPDDMSFTSRLFSQVNEKNVVDVFEKRYITRSGTVLWCKLRSEAVRDEAGVTQYRIVMVEDISKEKENELFQEQMVAIVESSGDAIFRCDTNSRIEFWSKGAEKLYGYSAEEVIGEDAGFIVAMPESRNYCKNHEQIRRGDGAIDPDSLGRHKDGHFIEVSVQVFPIRDKENRTIAFAAIHRDISRLKQLEEQLRHSQRMETAGMLAGGVAHDFNNILTVIQGACEIMSQDFAPGSSTARQLDLIGKSTERASRLTRQLVAFSRKQQRSPEYLDPNTLLSDFSSMLRQTLGEDISMVTAFDSTWHIEEDPTLLEQIILNLMLNARHAMSRGGTLSISTHDITITEDSSPAESGKLHFTPHPVIPGDYIQLSVADSGVGMNYQILEHIFDPFYTTKAKGEGTGLGLSVVYGIVAQAGGAIRVITQVNRGTEFQVLLPRADSKPGQSEPQEQQPMPRGKGKILVLEDNEDIRQLSSTLLKSAGYTVIEAGSPGQVLDNEGDYAVDMILSDVVMPGMSGPEFSVIWQKKYPDAHFLFMSGFYDDNNHAEFLSTRNLIKKPFKPTDLLNRINQIMGNQ